MIIALGVSYYTLWEGVDRRSDDILQDMMQQDKDAADENLDIQYIELTDGNSLNLTIKNTGNIISHLEWIGVFDETLKTKEYFGIETRARQGTHSGDTSGPTGTGARRDRDGLEQP